MSHKKPRGYTFDWTWRTPSITKGWKREMLKLGYKTKTIKEKDQYGDIWFGYKKKIE